jgi:hypothetical protein
MYFSKRTPGPKAGCLAKFLKTPNNPQIPHDGAGRSDHGSSASNALRYKTNRPLRLGIDSAFRTEALSIRWPIRKKRSTKLNAAVAVKDRIRNTNRL